MGIGRGRRAGLLEIAGAPSLPTNKDAAGLLLKVIYKSTGDLDQSTLISRYAIR